MILHSPVISLAVKCKPNMLNTENHNMGSGLSKPLSDRERRISQRELALALANLVHEGICTTEFEGTTGRV